MSNNSSHSPRSIGDAEGLIGRPEGGRLMLSESNVCNCRHKRWVSSGAKGGNRVAGQVKDGLGTGCLYSLHCGLVQKSEGTQKSDEPVSKTTWNSCGGVPMVMLPTYVNYREKEGVGQCRTVYPLFPQWCLPLGVTYLLRSLSNHLASHRFWSQRYLHLIYFSCATLYAGYLLYDQALKRYLLHGKPRGITTGPPWPLDTQES